MNAVPYDTYGFEPRSRIRSVPPDVRRVLTGYQTKMADYLFQMSCLDGLDAFADDHSLPLQFLTQMHKVMELCDESNRFFVHYLRRQGRAVQCRPGCAHCCRNMPAGVTLAELLFTYHGMQQSGAFPLLFRRCLEAEELLTRLFLQCQGRERDLKPRPVISACPEEVLQLYQDQGQPCRFCRENLCDLYAFRPIPCRMHFSLTPRHWCDPQHFQFPYAMIINLEPGGCVYDALARIEQRLRLNLSGILVCGLLELTINVMQFEPIRWRR